MEIVTRSIGIVRSGRTEAIDDDWDAVPARIELDARFDADALLGLEEFSHVEVVYVFDRVTLAQETTAVRRPRGNPDWPSVGIFAQRAKARPNRLGVCVCALVAVDGTTLHLRGLDAIDGSPVLDIKPVMSGFLPRGPIREPAWSQELMAGYW